jgi:hypothetical protein
MQQIGTQAHTVDIARMVGMRKEWSMRCRARQDKCTQLITLYKHQISGLSGSHYGAGHVSVFCYWILSAFDLGVAGIAGLGVSVFSGCGFLN